MEGISENRKMTISYEELTEFPSITMKQISDFIGVKNDYSYDYTQIKSTNSKKQTLSVDLQSQIKSITIPSYQLLGYEFKEI